MTPAWTVAVLLAGLWTAPVAVLRAAVRRADDDAFTAALPYPRARCPHRDLPGGRS
ncbi:hypothetical protein GCM10022243_49140 [Saccharothrix violaceirubra]|uniref:Uncharacterized protein n=1 Tax=Saccharothrix violaceirubra TaxID=413306 RepID=A0A7W7SZB8_9PSEU|nr:hypothetical protein [Saccharothrix violaceirubra]MBB4963742.1 hypothetical protein [Saccharothrix violaceirubra]